MKNFLFKSIIIIITIIFTGSVVYISDKNRTQANDKTGFQAKQTDTDKFYSNKKLGAFVENGQTCFRLFTPNAEKVSLVLFDKVDDQTGKIYEMTRDEDAVWEIALDGELYGKFLNRKHR